MHWAERANDQPLHRSHRDTDPFAFQLRLASTHGRGGGGGSGGVEGNEDAKAVSGRPWCERRARARTESQYLPHRWTDLNFPPLNSVQQLLIEEEDKKSYQPTNSIKENYMANSE